MDLKNSRKTLQKFNISHLFSGYPKGEEGGQAGKETGSTAVDMPQARHPDGVTYDEDLPSRSEVSSFTKEQCCRLRSKHFPLNIKPFFQQLSTKYFIRETVGQPW